MQNIYLINQSQRSKLELHGFQISSDLTSTASKHLISTLRHDITDISDIYSLDQLLLIYEAVRGEANIIPMCKRVPRFGNESKVESRAIDLNTNRKKIRIDLTTDISYANPLLEHLARYDNLEIHAIKTGLAIKHVHGGYKSNIANFNELRTINGELHGNLYFNQVRSDDQYIDLSITEECNWFRGYAQLYLVNVYKVIEYLNEKNIEYLKSLSAVSNKRRKSNTQRLLLKI